MTREKLLAAAVDTFGQRGFDGASTRQLAEAAGVNLQAIPYYFGGKEGLYRAAADYVANAISNYVSSTRDRVRTRLLEAQARGIAIDASEARGLLTELLQTMVELFTSRQSEPWARFILREQAAPTDAFDILFSHMMRPLFDVFAQLLAVLLGEAPTSEHVRLRSMALVGSVMVFRVAHAAVLAVLDKPELGPHETGAIRSLAAELVASIRPEDTTK
ncbi:CerR family C-terminal domain-containing protein [Telmatospirillum sp.]|uniref:CerR family C-terminal domain-containing protein n=1 Tax=Telmatospirillum sp. TaxID=2079197 RepID=UPI00283B498E|nr:CerR family C-terminal domain-containing protein [Telmatospirillum sp.]MDR3435369.1 CerR family C-terminal domain-containing protein [Telmatospirillum sp.]